MPPSSRSREWSSRYSRIPPKHFDRGEKFEAYQQIPTLEEYVLVSVRDRRVEVFRRARGWICDDAAGRPLALESLNLVLEPGEIFDQLG
jgi:Uma2 family endonuclease